MLFFKRLLPLLTALSLSIAFFVSCGTHDQNPALAQFKGGDIRTDDYVDYFLSSTKYKPEVQPTTENLQDIVTTLGLEKMALIEGINQGIEQDSLYLESYENNKRKTLFFKYMRLEIIDQVITDSLVQTFYRNFSPQYHVKYILRPVLSSSTPQFAQTQKDSIYYVYQQLQNGADFEDMAKQFSQDVTSNYKGGSLGFVIRESLGDAALRAAMDTLSDFTYSKPIRGYEGYYILYKGEKRDVPVPPFEEASPHIWQTLYRTRRHDINAVLQKRFDQLAERYFYEVNGNNKKALVEKAGGSLDNAPTAPLYFENLNNDDMATVLATYDNGVIRAYELFEEKNRTPGNLLEFNERFDLISQRHLFSKHADELGYMELADIKEKMQDVRESLIRSFLHRREVLEKAQNLLDFVDEQEEQAGSDEKSDQFRRVSTERRVREQFEEQLKSKYDFKFFPKHFSQALDKAETQKKLQNKKQESAENSNNKSIAQ